MAKGGEYEREISKRLSKWWTQNADKPRSDVFWRTAGSGGMATNRFKKGQGAANCHGDITATDPVGQPFINYFLLEIKRGYSDELAVLPLIDGTGTKPALLEFWKQAERDREICGRYESLLIFKRDRKKAVVMITQRLFRKMSHYCGTWEQSTKDPRISLHLDGYGHLVLLPFESFLNWFNPEVVHQWTTG